MSLGAAGAASKPIGRFSCTASKNFRILGEIIGNPSHYARCFTCGRRGGKAKGVRCAVCVVKGVLS